MKGSKTYCQLSQIYDKVFWNKNPKIKLTKDNFIKTGWMLLQGYKIERTKFEDNFDLADFFF